MCGIAGIVSLTGRPVDPVWIKRMCDTIAHRGPDDAGYAFFDPGRGTKHRGATSTAYTDEKFAHLNEHLPVFGGSYSRREMAESDFQVALGHRRLSILDLSAYGHQPMATPDRRHWIVHNGEAYNFQAIRDELEQRDHRFRTGTDTEVILQLWNECGPPCLEQLDGMFAFGIYDSVEHRLDLVRDRFGVKPVYYAISDGFFLFASEIKAIFASGIVKPALNASSLVEYMTFQNVYKRQTIWENVQLLMPGEHLRVDPRNGVVGEPRKYIDAVAAFGKESQGQESVVNDVSMGFRGAVQRQLISDVPVGSYLSGGMDSGSIVAVAGTSISRLHTFTGGFDLTNVDGIEQGFDERRLAERLSYLLQTEHYDVVLHAGDMPAAMDKITWHMDDPRVGMCHQNWYVAKLASKFVKVCLAGTGGDELFAGYPWRYRAAFGGGSIDDFDNSVFDSWHRLLPQAELSRLFSSDLQRHLGDPRHSFDEVMASAPAWDQEASHSENLLHRALYFEFKTFLHGLLITDDHISMAHSLETRVPFLDNALNTLAWRLRPSQKLRLAELEESSRSGEFMDSSEGKYVLRRAMEKFLPSEFLYQRKQGFSPPDENWYRGPSMDYIKSILFDQRTLERPWFDQDFVRSCLNEHFDGKRNHRLLIWSLVSIEWIQRHFVDTEANDIVEMSQTRVDSLQV
ncbi:MAG: asparagine synthase (glutamine-hydrolyzing) [Phycisphaerales bacterium]|nr:asparagine synthase (glutamine-hydrolyzing) [Phycisphaerales bacterium]